MKEMASFDLLIDRRVGAQYRARIVASELGEASVDFDLPFLEDPSIDSEGVTRAYRDLRRRLLQKEVDPRDFGKKLFLAAFKDSIGSFFRQCRHSAKSRGQVLRIRLRLADVPELGVLPWEMLCDPQDDQFLAMADDLSVVRYLDGPGRSEDWGVTEPLRVLAVVASPLGFAKLDVDREWQHLEESFAPLRKQGKVVLDFVRPGTIEALMDQLETQAYQVLHFIGHGSFDSRYQTGELILESEDGGHKALDAHRLATVLQQRSSIRLVVLNVCEGAKHSKTDTYSGLAQSLLRHGVPAVIGMQQKIADGAAILFSKAFYETLVANESIDVAVAKARRRLYRNEGAGWALPVFFLRSSGNSNTAALAEKQEATTGNALPRSLLSRESRKGRLTKNFQPRLALLAGLAILAAITVTSVTMLTGSETRCLSPNGVDMDFIYIEGGEFSMGTENIEGAEELPKLASVGDFCMSKYEVTQEQWRQLMGEDPPNERYPDPKRPVTVNWADALRFVQTLNDSNAGDNFSLPTEPEWEYVSRAGTKTMFSFGDDIFELENYGNCLSESGSDGYDGTAPVGSFKPNPWGFYDLHGNVREWVIASNPLDDSVTVRSILDSSVSKNLEAENLEARGLDTEGLDAEDLGAEDLDTEDLDGESPSDSASGSSEDEGSGKDLDRIVRGGSFESKAQNCRSVTRQSIKETHSSGVGFRVVYRLPKIETED